MRAPLGQDARELPAGKPEQGDPRRSVSEQSTSLGSKLWETVCWLQGSISSVQRLRWPMLVSSFCKRSQHMNLFRWRAVPQRSLCVGNGSPRERAKGTKIRESRQNLPPVEVRKSQEGTRRGASSHILNLTARRAAKVQHAQKREVLPRFLGRCFFTQEAAAIVSAHQYRYRLSGSTRGTVAPLFSSLLKLHV